MSAASGDRAAPSALRERLLALVAQIVGEPQAAVSLPVDGPLSEVGMSSLKMMNLMLSVEVDFNVTIPQSEITPDNFRSVASVEALLLKLGVRI